MYMHFIFESIFVGVYSVVIFLVLSLFFQDYTKLLFVTGLFKHFLGYFLQIHRYYCNHGYACEDSPSTHIYSGFLTSKSNITLLVFESIIEGFAFLVFGLSLHHIFTQILGKYNIHNKKEENIIMIFLLGLSFHLVAEFTGMHTYFCKERCTV